MFQQQIARIIAGIRPVIQRIGIKTRAERFSKVFQVPLTQYNLRWLETLQKFIDVLCLTLSHQKLSGRYIQKGTTHALLLKKYGSQVIIRLLLNNIIVIGNPWCYQLSN